MQHPIVHFDPVFLDLGFVQIHWYGVTYLLGFGLYWLLGRYRIRHHNTGWSRDELSDFMFYGALGVILGGRLGWLLFYNDTSLLQDPLLVFRVWQGGMSFHGGLVGVIVAMLYFKHKSSKDFFQVADFVAPLAPLGIAAVRLGNFINGELWGRLSEKPWAMIFPNALPYDLWNEQSRIETLHTLSQQGALAAFARHPSQLYEALSEGFLTFAVVWWVASSKRRPGVVSASFLLCYGVSRFAVEFFREPDANRGFIAFDWMTMGHMLSLPLIVAGLFLLLRARR